MGKMKRVNRSIIHSVIMGRAPWRKGDVFCLLRHKAGGKFALATAGRSRAFEEGS